MPDATARTALSHDSSQDTAVERWIRSRHDLAVDVAFPIDGYLAERETDRRLRQRLGEMKRLDGHRVDQIGRLEVEIGRLNRELASANGSARRCLVCAEPCRWIECPTGGWWAHDVHPFDDHDAIAGGPVESTWDTATPARHDSPSCAPAGGRCACQGSTDTN